MAAPVLHAGSALLCAHGGRAHAIATSPRVMVGGQAAATLATPYGVVGCGLPPASGGPCVTAQWTVGATRVFASGQPLLVQTGRAVCLPTGSPLFAVAGQARVLAI